MLDSTAHALHGTLGADNQVGMDGPTRISSDVPANEIISINGFE